MISTGATVVISTVGTFIIILVVTALVTVFLYYKYRYKLKRKVKVDDDPYGGNITMHANPHSDTAT